MSKGVGRGGAWGWIFAIAIGVISCATMSSEESADLYEARTLLETAVQVRHVVYISPPTVAHVGPAVTPTVPPALTLAPPAAPARIPQMLAGSGVVLLVTATE